MNSRDAGALTRSWFRRPLAGPIVRHAIVLSAAIAMAMAAANLAAAQSRAANPITEAVVLRDPEIPVAGNPDGDITIVAYSDFNCPYCRTVDPELQEIVRKDGKIRLVFKDWPVLGDGSVIAAKLALAAKYQNKFVEAHNALIGTKTRLTESGAKALLARAGIDTERVLRDLAANDKAITAILLRNHEQAQAFGFQGTPAFIIGKFRVPGVIDAASFTRAIADARAAQKK